MQKAAQGRLLRLGRTNYFIAPEAALAAIIDDVAADEAASIADEAAIIDDVAAAEAEASVDVAGATTAGGVVVVVVVSSFLLQAAKETAAASVTINNAVFIFLLVLGGSDNDRAVVGTLSRGAPSFKDKESGGIPVPNPRL